MYLNLAFWNRAARNRQIRKCDAAEKCPVDIRFSHAFRSNMYVLLGFGFCYAAVGLSSGQISPLHSFLFLVEKMRQMPLRDNFSRGREKLIEEDFVFFSHTQRK